MRTLTASFFLLGLTFFSSGCRLPDQWQRHGASSGQRSQGTGEVVRRAIVVEDLGDVGYQLSSLNDTARYLAGMPGGTRSGLAGHRSSERWQLHRANMDALWQRFIHERKNRIDSFSHSELGGLASQQTLFYPFSGPDILFAMTFFPGCRNYILGGLEGTEMLPQLESLSSAELATGLDGIYSSITTALNYSFFITKDMRVDLQRSRFQGTLPIVMVFLARLGADIQDVTPMHLNRQGQALVGYGDGSCPGYLVRCSFGRGDSRNIYYFRENLADSALQADYRYLSFVRQFGGVATFLKSASYLMHGSDFSMIRNAILNQSVAVLQDDSGIPVRYFQNAQWTPYYYGHYSGPIDMFSGYYQPALARAYQAGTNVKSIDFGVGYKFVAGDSALILARKNL